jgi:hypothetical protein
MISSRNLAGLAPPGRLTRHLLHLAVLDAVLWPEWSERAFSYDQRWRRGERLASMRDGEGDFLHVWFPAQGGAAMRGFAHESPMSPWSAERSKTPTARKPWPGLFEGLPREYRYLQREKAFGDEGEVTFVAWWTREEGWRIGDVSFPREWKNPDGSETLLTMLDGRPETYARLTSERLGRKVSKALVARVFAHEPLDEKAVLAANPEADAASVLEEIGRELGYPLTLNKAASSKRGKDKNANVDSLANDALFTVTRNGNTVRLIIGGKVQAEVERDVFAEVLDEVRRRMLKKR